ncbi:Pentatricopeptide repeat-containing protein [Drosera capensis]
MLSNHAPKRLGLKDPIFHTSKYPKPSISQKPFKARVLIHHKTLSNHGNPKTHMKFHSGYPFFQDSRLHCISNRVSSQPNKTPYRKDDSKCEGELLSGSELSESDEEIEKEFGLWRGMDARLLTCKLRDQGSWDRVWRVFGWMKRQKDYVPNVVHYQVVLRSLGLACRWDELRLCWIEMGKDGVVPTNYVYSMLVDVCGRAGFVREALWWIKEMRSRGKFPNEVVMGTVVGVLKKAGEFDAADRFYKDWCVGKADLEGIDLDGLGETRSRAQKDSVRLKSFLSAEILKMGASNGSLNVAVNSNRKGYVRRLQLSATYDALIDLYGKADRLSDAVNAFSELLASGLAVDVISFNTMIHTFGSHGHLPEAVSLFFKMIGRGIYPDIRTYDILILLYGEAGNVDAALRFFRDIREVGLFPSVGTYRAVLHVLCRRQMVQEADDVIRDMRESGVPVDRHFLPVVMAMYASDELRGQAAKVLRMSNLNCRFSSKLYARIINIYAEKGLWAEAEAVFFRKQDSGEEKKDVMEYNVMIKAYGVAELYDKAFSLFKEMRNAGTWPDQCTYNSLIQMFSGVDLVDRGKELLAEMQGLGLIPNSSTFAGVIASYVRLGRLSDAVDVFRDMERAAVEPNEAAYGSLINGYAAAGRLDDALYYYRLMEDKGLSANQIVLTSLIKAYRFSNTNDLQGAKRIYERLVEMEGEPDKPASSCMLNLYAKLGMIEDAEMMYNTMKEKERLDKFTYPVMITLYKNMGKLDKAVSVADDMKGSLCHPSERVKDSADLFDQFSLNGAIDIYAKLGKMLK